MWYHSLYDIIDCDIVHDIIYMHISYMILHLLYSIRYHIWWVNKPMQPAPACIHSASTLTAHCPLQAAFYGVISAFLWRSASKYCAMQPWHCTVPVRRSLLCSPGVKFGSKHFTNRVQTTHRRRLHQRASASVASFWSAAAGAGSSASTAGC